MCELFIMWIQDCMMKLKIAKDQQKIYMIDQSQAKVSDQRNSKGSDALHLPESVHWNQLSCLHHNTNTSSCIGMFSLLCSVFFLLPAVLTIHQMFESFV